MNTALRKSHVNWFSLSYGIVESSSEIFSFLVSTFSQPDAALDTGSLQHVLTVGENDLP